MPELFFYHFYGGRELRSRIRKSPIFRVCFLLMWKQNCNLGLNPSSDIRIERFKSLNCFVTINNGFVSSEAEFVRVRFFASVSYSCGTKIVICAYILARTSELSNLKAWIVFFTTSKGFVSSEAKFVEVRFFASVSYSSRTKIVIWA